MLMGMAFMDAVRLAASKGSGELTFAELQAICKAFYEHGLMKGRERR